MTLTTRGNQVNWLRDTTKSYRCGWVEGEAGERDAYRLRSVADDVPEYERGFADAKEVLKDGTGTDQRPT